MQSVPDSKMVEQCRSQMKREGLGLVHAPLFSSLSRAHQSPFSLFLLCFCGFAALSQNLETWGLWKSFDCLLLICLLILCFVSITIDDVVFVVDCGKTKEKVSDGFE